MEKLRVVFLLGGHSRYPRGEVSISINNNSFTALLTNGEDTLTILGYVYSEGNVLAGSFCDADGTVKSVLMQKVKNGYSGIYTTIMGQQEPYRSRCEWVEII